ncbi:MAG TPA: DUF3037 domain-containing protein [Pyrinomonadaceae bacterium]|nr:DUF3037 domain-containing protein [Pyrinomonadaceae bacterium]
MPDKYRYDYAVVRVVPKVDREEFINAGVILSCPDLSFLEARINLNEARLRALDPNVDLDLVKHHLAAIPIICRGGEEAGSIGQLPQRQRFHWLVSPRSTIIQTSPVHTGRCHDPAAALEHLLATMVNAAEKQ